VFPNNYALHSKSADSVEGVLTLGELNRVAVAFRLPVAEGHFIVAVC